MELIKIDKEGNVALSETIGSQLANFEKQLKEINDQEAKLKTAILEEMEKRGIIKLESEDLTITYYSPTDRETFNKESFREDHPDMYDEYVTFTPVKSSIRIKVK